MAIFFTSDLHFCHNQPFIYKARGFFSVEEMNEAIIERWNEIVNENDDVYILGDIMLNDNEKGIECLKRLNGKIRIICGNHDTPTRKTLYKTCDNVVEVCDGTYFQYKRFNFYLSHYPSLTNNYDEDLPLKKKVINLCGHTHTDNPIELFNQGIIFNVGVDGHYCCPWNIDDIISFIKRVFDVRGDHDKEVVYEVE